MLKCLFTGHKWKHVITYEGTRTSFWRWGIKETKHRLVKEYYQCEKCKLWKEKIFVDNELEETKYFVECPIEKKEEK